MQKFCCQKSINMFDCSVCVGYLVFLSLLSLLHDRLCQASQEYLSMERSINKQSKNKNRYIYTVYLHLYNIFICTYTNIPGIPGIPVAGQDSMAPSRGMDSESRAPIRRKQ